MSEDQYEPEESINIRLPKGSRPYWVLMAAVLGGGGVLSYFGIATTEDLQRIATAQKATDKKLDDISSKVDRAVSAAEAQREVNRLQNANSDLRFNTLTYEMTKLKTRVSKIENRKD